MPATTLPSSHLSGVGRAPVDGRRCRRGDFVAQGSGAAAARIAHCTARFMPARRTAPRAQRATVDVGRGAIEATPPAWARRPDGWPGTSSVMERPRRSPIRRPRKPGRKPRPRACSRADVGAEVDSRLALDLATARRLDARGFGPGWLDAWRLHLRLCRRPHDEVGLGSAHRRRSGIGHRRARRRCNVLELGRRFDPGGRGHRRRPRRGRRRRNHRLAYWRAVDVVRHRSRWRRRDGLWPRHELGRAPGGRRARTR